jgi:putative tributyrin esterase
MAVCEFHLDQNNVLQKMTSFTAIVPEGKPGPFPVFYLLHGLSDDHTAWTRRSNIERYVSGLPLMVVMPNGERGFYTDAKEKPRAAFETNLVQDIIGFVDRTFQTIPTREGRVIAGLSMGGYGAAKLALKYPDLFCAGVSHSGAVQFGEHAYAADDDWGREWRAVLGPNPKGGPDDIFALAEKIDRTKLPALRIDCGVDDFLIEENRALGAHLTSLGIPHEYVEHPGEHNWQYWNLHILDTLRFFTSVLGIEGFNTEGHL